ncbi:MAG TPA: hypothetical protein VHX42_02700 [Candidatus Babeliales bacterium]|jgi:hypothetical protein|nr:hypothetical protein [Candidatus Babeliales bacterium]
MNKWIVLFCVVLSSSVAHAMKNELEPSNSFSFSSLFYALFSSCPVQYESKFVSDLRVSKKNFADNLIDKETKNKICGSSTMVTFSVDSMCQNSVQFLQYCYCFKHYDDLINPTVLHFEENPELLEKCLTAERDGYSALGVAMISEDTFFKERYDFIQVLLQYGFKPTVKDIQLAWLFLYDEIMKKEWKQLHYLFDANPGVLLNTLSKELKRLILQYMIEMLKKKKDYWMLSGF